MPGRFRDYRPPRNRRLPAPAYETPGQFCFFTARAAQGSDPFGRPALARIATECLLGQRVKSGCELAVFCIMPDHVHAVVAPAVDGASSLTYMDRFKGWCAHELRQAGWSGPAWQPRSYDHVIRTDTELVHVVDYVLNNPVRRELCQRSADWPWCGIPEPTDQ